MKTDAFRKRKFGNATLVKDYICRHMFSRGILQESQQQQRVTINHELVHNYMLLLITNEGDRTL